MKSVSMAALPRLAALLIAARDVLPSSRARRARATCGLVARGWARLVVERAEPYLRIGCGYD